MSRKAFWIFGLVMVLTAVVTLSVLAAVKATAAHPYEVRCHRWHNGTQQCVLYLPRTDHYRVTIRGEEDRKSVVEFDWFPIQEKRK
jgi:hypothetical protein